MKAKMSSVLGILIVAAMTFAPVDSIGAHHNHHKNKGHKVKGGPPPWAPAHGYRAKMRHIYYPEQNVYYDTQNEVYIYVDMGRWEVSARIPLPLRNTRMDQVTQVALELESDWPQEYNDQHQERYRTRRSSR